MKRIALFFLAIVCFFIATSGTSAQTSHVQHDSLVLERIWVWVETNSTHVSAYFKHHYTYPLQPSQTYAYDGHLFYHFPDRCVDNIVVVDSFTLTVVDVCVGECEWVRKRRKDPGDNTSQKNHAVCLHGYFS